MAETVIHVRASRTQVRKMIDLAVKAASGHTEDGKEAADALQVRVGMTALARIKDAFIVKARGGTDAAGLKWKPLSPKTIAYSRRHPGVPKNRSGNRPSWMLTAKQREEWWTAYRTGLAMYRGDKERAAKRAWAIAKAGGAKTLIGEYGATAVEILRDTGLLLNSLSPGISPGSVEHQVFRVGAGEVIVGTNRKWAWAHHKGIPGRLPKRPLWPDPETWPAEWWNDIEEQARQGFTEILLYFLRRNP